MDYLQVHWLLSPLCFQGHTVTFHFRPCVFQFQNFFWLLLMISGSVFLQVNECSSKAILKFKTANFNIFLVPSEWVTLSLVLHLLSFLFFFNTLGNKVCCGVWILFYSFTESWFTFAFFVSASHEFLAELRLPFNVLQALLSFLVELLFCFGCAGSPTAASGTLSSCGA